MTMPGGGGGGGTAGGKYILTFQVSGSGAQALANITNQLMAMATQTTGGTQAIQGLINQINALGMNALKTGTKLLTLEAQLSLVEQGLSQLKAAAEWMKGGGEEVIGGFMKLGKNVLDAVSPLENAQNMMMVIGKMSREQAKDITESVKGLVAATPFKTQELVDMNLALIMGKVSLDQWKDSAGNLMTLQTEAAKGFSRLEGSILDLYGNTKVTATSIVADFAALTGNVGDRMPTFVRGLQRALSTGNTRLLMDQVNAEALQALTGSTKLSKMEGTAQDAMKRLYAYLQKYNAVGMSALASSTATGIMSNFEEIPTLIYQAIGGDPNDPNSPYSAIKNAFAGMFMSIAKTINDPEWRQGISNALLPIIEVFSTAMKVVGEAAAMVLKFLADHPTITKWTTIIMAAGAAMMILVGTLAAAAAAMGIFAISQIGMVIAMEAAKPVIRAWAASIWAAIAPFVIMAAKIILVVAAIAAVGYAVKSFIDANEPLKNLLEDITTLFQAFWESMSNWSGDTSKISVETAQKLKKAGMLEIFLELNKGIWAVRQVGRQMWEDFSGPLLNALKLIGSVFGLNTEEINDQKADLEAFASVFKEFFIGGLSLISKFAVVLSGINAIWVTFRSVGEMAFTALFGLVHGLWNGLVLVVTALKDIIMLAVNLVAMDFSAAWDNLKGLSKGYNDFKSGAFLNGIGGAMYGAWGDSLANVQRASDQYDQSVNFANTPIMGERKMPTVTSVDGGIATGRQRPVQFEQAQLESLIQSGRMDMNQINQAISKGEIVVTVNSTLNVDGERMATHVNRINAREQGRSVGMGRRG